MGGREVEWGGGGREGGTRYRKGSSRGWEGEIGANSARVNTTLRDAL